MLKTLFICLTIVEAMWKRSGFYHISLATKIDWCVNTKIPNYLKYLCLHFKWFLSKILGAEVTFEIIAFSTVKTYQTCDITYDSTQFSSFKNIIIIAVCQNLLFIIHMSSRIRPTSSADEEFISSNLSFAFRLKTKPISTASLCSGVGWKTKIIPFKK